MNPEPRRDPVTVAISLRTVGLILAVAACIWLASLLTHVLLVVFAAILLATAVDQPTTWLRRHGVPRPIGVLAVYVTLLLAVLASGAALMPLVSAELLALQSELPAYATRIENLAHRLAPNVAAAQRLSFSSLATQLAGHMEEVAGRITTVTLAAGQTLALVFATLVIAYFLAVDPAMGTRVLARFAPPALREHATRVGASVRLRIGAWARGQMLIALSFGVAMGVGLWLLGVPYAASLAVTAAVLELIPYVGGLVTVILAILMALTAGLPQVVGVIVLYLVLVNLEAHVLAPLLLGHAVGLPSVAILIALLVGVELFGILGALLAVPTAVIVWAIIEEVWPTAPVGTREGGMSRARSLVRRRPR